MPRAGLRGSVPRWPTSSREGRGFAGAMAKIVPSSDPSCVEEAARLLRQGELVCYPTDTVYGIGAAAGHDGAVRRLFAVKGRPLDKPVPLLIAGAEDAARLTEVTPVAAVARTLMGRFWPG